MPRNSATIFLCVALVIVALACTLTSTQGLSPTLPVTTEAPTAVPLPSPYLTQAENENSCLVLVENLNVRNGPGEKYKILGYLHAGNVITIVDPPALNTDWFRVETHDKVIGFVNSKFTTCKRSAP